MRWSLLHGKLNCRVFFTDCNKWCIEDTVLTAEDRWGFHRRSRRVTGTSWSAMGGARAGPDMAAPYYWTRALAAARARRARSRGAGVASPLACPNSPLSFSIPAQTARAHGIQAQRARGHGGLRTVVRHFKQSFYDSLNFPFFWRLFIICRFWSERF